MAVLWRARPAQHRHRDCPSTYKVAIGAADGAVTYSVADPDEAVVASGMATYGTGATYNYRCPVRTSSQSLIAIKVGAFHDISQATT